MEDKSVLENLILFIRNEIKEFKKPINRDTLLEDNLGVTGDDAEDMILNYAKKFKVDISNFEFEKYFNDEPTFAMCSRKVNALTIGHLEKGIIAGHLDEEVITAL